MQSNTDINIENESLGWMLVSAPYEMRKIA